MIPYVTAISLLLALASPLAYCLDPYEIMERSDRAIHPHNLQGNIILKMTSRRGDTRTINLMAFQKKITEHRENRLFLFTFPPSVRGTALLVHSYLDENEDRMWIYLPAVGRIKRVNLNVSGGGYFMGSDFTYSDLITRSVPEMEYGLIGQEEATGHPSYAIEVRYKTPEIQRKYGYSRQIHYIRKSDYVPVKIVFYDLAGDLLKKLIVLEVADLGDYHYPSHVIMENLQTGHSSEMIGENIEVPQDISDSYFTLRYLEHQR